MISIQENIFLAISHVNESSFATALSATSLGHTGLRYRTGPLVYSATLALTYTGSKRVFKEISTSFCIQTTKPIANSSIDFSYSLAFMGSILTAGTVLI